MRRKIEEQVVIFASILKWFALATVIGVAVGFSTALFMTTLGAAIGLSAKFRYYYLALPFTLAVMAAAKTRLFPRADAYNTDRVIQYIHDNQSPPLISVVKAFSFPIFTIASGGSAGREAPAADIGAIVGAGFGRAIGLSGIDRRKLMICGISAGFSAVFGTPIAGAIFGVEVLYVGTVLYEVLLPSFIAGITAYQVSSALGVAYVYHPAGFVPVFSELFFIKVVLLGAMCGLVSLLFIECVNYSKTLSSKIKMPESLKGFMAGAMIVGLVFVFSGKYLGLGMEQIHASLHGERMQIYDFALKILFTVLTVAFGGCGGLITPVFFIGASFAGATALFAGLNPSTAAAIGMVALLSGACNTPIAAGIMSVELFGSQLAPYAVTACIVSFLMTGHRSIYPSQVLSIIKSSSFEAELGHKISKTKPALKQMEGFWDRFLKKK